MPWVQLTLVPSTVPHVAPQALPGVISQCRARSKSCLSGVAQKSEKLVNLPSFRTDSSSTETQKPGNLSQCDWHFSLTGETCLSAFLEGDPAVSPWCQTANKGQSFLGPSVGRWVRLENGEALFPWNHSGFQVSFENTKQWAVLDLGCRM